MTEIEYKESTKWYYDPELSPKWKYINSSDIYVLSIPILFYDDLSFRISKNFSGKKFTLSTQITDLSESYKRLGEFDTVEEAKNAANTHLKCLSKRFSFFAKNIQKIERLTLI
jgi:hypothetical protein